MQVARTEAAAPNASWANYQRFDERSGTALGTIVIIGHDPSRIVALQTEIENIRQTLGPRVVMDGLRYVDQGLTGQPMHLGRWTEEFGRVVDLAVEVRGQIDARQFRTEARILLARLRTEFASQPIVRVGFREVLQHIVAKLNELVDPAPSPGEVPV